MPTKTGETKAGGVQGQFGLYIKSMWKTKSKKQESFMNSWWYRMERTFSNQPLVF